MTRTLTRIGTLAVLLAGSLLVAGCAESSLHLSDDFGAAYKQDTMAQIANPDAKYTGNPAPGALGPAVAIAQENYVNGKVVQPAAARAAAVPTGGGGSGGGGGGSQ